MYYLHEINFSVWFLTILSRIMKNDLKPAQETAILYRTASVNIHVDPISAFLQHKVKTQYLQNVNHSRYFHLMSNFSSIHFHTKRLYVH